MLNSVESQASNIDEWYLLSINFLYETWPKVIGGGKFKSKVDFDYLIISYVLANYRFLLFSIKNIERYSRVGTSARDRCEIFNNLENMRMSEWDVNDIFTLNK